MSTWSIEGVQMITFITDVKPGEQDILTAVCQYPLQVRTLEGEIIDEVTAPENGWTHLLLALEAERLAPFTGGGADAYLGDIWVGSTEV